MGDWYSLNAAISNKPRISQLSAASPKNLHRYVSLFMLINKANLVSRLSPNRPLIFDLQTLAHQVMFDLQVTE